MTQAPIKLQSAFLALQMAKNDFVKISGLLPTPSHSNTSQGRHGENVILVYLINQNISTAKQFSWLSTVKRAWQENLVVPLSFVDEVYLSQSTQSTGIIYSFHELSQFFKSDFVTYPTIYYPSSKKELYRRLVWYATRLNSGGLLERDLMNAVAIKMNDKLKDKYNHKETLKKASTAYHYIKENARAKLNKDEVTMRLKKGGTIRGAQRKEEHTQNIQRVKEALPLHVKANGKVSVTALSAALQLNRKTIQRIMKIFLAVCFFGFIHIKLLLGVYHNTNSLSRTFLKAHQYELLEGFNQTNFIRSSALLYTDSLSRTFG